MATNKRYEEGKRLRLTVETTVESGDPLLFGTLPAVATTDYSAADGKASVDMEGVYNLTVTATGDPIALYDAIYFHTGGVLNNVSSGGVQWGWAFGEVLEDATVEIPVRIAQM